MYTLHDSKIFNQSQTMELTLQAAWYYNIEQSRGIEKEEEKF